MKSIFTLSIVVLINIGMKAQSPIMLKNINTTTANSGNSNPNSFAVSNGSLFFAANNGTNGSELWKSDGTAPGTTMLKDITTASGGSVPRYLTNVGTTLYFEAGIPASFSRGLYKSDGTVGGTTLVKAMTIYSLIDVNGNLFIIGDGADGSGTELWKSDGTAAGTVLVKDIKPGSASSSIGNSAILNNQLIFSADDGTNGKSIWMSDGTSAGTTLVKSFGVSLQSGIVVSNGIGFFSVNSTGGTELWKTDGTLAGTVAVKDINPGSSSSSPGNLININNTLFFSATDGTNGFELWSSDGTSSGTSMVKDVSPSGSALTTPSLGSNYFTNVNGTLYFVAYNPTTGDELWKSDGTSAGTTLVKDIVPGTGSPFAAWLPSFINLNGTLFFTANDPIAGKELWKSDGTSAGTVLLGDINPGTGDPLIANLTNFNNNLYFSADDGTNGNELWTLSVVTGVKSIEKAASVSAYPNPSNGLFKFESDLLISEIKIYNSIGEVVSEKKLSSKLATIDLSGERSGVYFYQLTTENNNFKTGKIILQ